MLHACVQRFDVTENLEKLGGKLQIRWFLNLAEMQCIRTLEEAAKSKYQQTFRDNDGLIS